MRNQITLMTRMVARLFHVFVQGRLKAEMSDPDFRPVPVSTDVGVEKKLAPKRQRKLRESQAAPVRWAEYSHSDLPVIGVL